MQIVEQKLEDITGALSTLHTSWQDHHALNVIEQLQRMAPRSTYTDEDVAVLFDEDFRLGFTLAQLLPGTSKDEFQDRLSAILGSGNLGAKTFELKRPDVPFILVTDGITWMRRMNDLRKLLHLQNQGKIMRIYTMKMVAQFRADLKQLKVECGL